MAELRNNTRWTQRLPSVFETTIYRSHSRLSAAQADYQRLLLGEIEIGDDHWCCGGWETAIFCLFEPWLMVTFTPPPLSTFFSTTSPQLLLRKELRTLYWDVCMYRLQRAFRCQLRQITCKTNYLVHEKCFTNHRFIIRDQSLLNPCSSLLTDGSGRQIIMYLFALMTIFLYIY